MRRVLELLRATDRAGVRRPVRTVPLPPVDTVDDTPSSTSIAWNPTRASATCSGRARRRAGAGEWVRWAVDLGDVIPARALGGALYPATDGTVEMDVACVYEGDAAAHIAADGRDRRRRPGPRLPRGQQQHPPANPHRRRALQCPGMRRRSAPGWRMATERSARVLVHRRRAASSSSASSTQMPVLTARAPGRRGRRPPQPLLEPARSVVAHTARTRPCDPRSSGRGRSSPISRTPVTRSPFGPLCTSAHGQTLTNCQG